MKQETESIPPSCRVSFIFLYLSQEKFEGGCGKKEVSDQIPKRFGLVPSFFKMVPDSTLEHEWELFKAIQLNETAIPSKYKELIGVAISSAMRCRYCSLFHTEMAKLNGATDEEIEEAVRVAKCSTGWSTYINGMQMDYDQFKNEVLEVCDYVRRKEIRKAA